VATAASPGRDDPGLGGVVGGVVTEHDAGDDRESR
jgi:hypothetical protein